MRLLTICTSPLVAVPYRGGSMETGIYKRPVEGRVFVGRLRVGDDQQADPRYHGGEDRAAYLYPSEHYAHFRDLLPPHVEIVHGLFGENFTVEGVSEDDVEMGEVFRVGGAQLQVTEPRGPCFKLGYKLEDARFPKVMLASGRLGFYLRTIEEGFVEAGDTIERVSREGHGVTVAEMIRTRWAATHDLKAIERALGVPSVSTSLRARLERLRVQAMAGTSEDVD